jgi:sRNA-binding protein
MVILNQPTPALEFGAEETYLLSQRFPLSFSARTFLGNACPAKLGAWGILAALSAHLPAESNVNG